MFIFGSEMIWYRMEIEFSINVFILQVIESSYKIDNQTFLHHVLLKFCAPALTVIIFLCSECPVCMGQTLCCYQPVCLLSAWLVSVIMSFEVTGRLYGVSRGGTKWHKVFCGLVSSILLPLLWQLFLKSPGGSRITGLTLTPSRTWTLAESLHVSMRDSSDSLT